MQTKKWPEENVNDFDDYFDNQQRKNNKQSKRKWREIEAFKEQRRMQQEMQSYDDYLMH
ncbi:DUF3545 family protein [Colwellia sp. M166]|jgi:hypothetical protein|uniref:DUF3545 family protein n=1 Tax=Colwellia sp. M166 TaxID=2583805 RepID=UPI00211EB1FB|nr:DUF3545 family protein [Colwellia sp. M166]UUO21930.1 DUF3545 family protein [Colwellia sp. M166]|tara:strand:+ start:4631 stop:4807 length:177 start_codon:yes stop_codon:yes gene_type:complete